MMVRLMVIYILLYILRMQGANGDNLLCFASLFFLSTLVALGK